jgi:hypothetical protein
MHSPTTCSHAADGLPHVALVAVGSQTDATCVGEDEMLSSRWMLSSCGEDAECSAAAPIHTVALRSSRSVEWRDTNDEVKGQMKNLKMTMKNKGRGRWLS